MKKLLKFLDEFWNGKIINEREDLGISTAVIWDNEGRNFTISRKGFVIHTGFGPILFKSEDLLRSYMSDSKKSILVDDDGDMIPVSSIKKIHTNRWVNFVNYSYRK